jgi:hypothetical protein
MFRAPAELIEAIRRAAQAVSSPAEYWTTYAG